MEPITLGYAPVKKQKGRINRKLAFGLAALLGFAGITNTRCQNMLGLDHIKLAVQGWPTWNVGGGSSVGLRIYGEVSIFKRCAYGNIEYVNSKYHPLQQGVVMEGYKDRADWKYDCPVERDPQASFRKSISFK